MKLIAVDKSIEHYRICKSWLENEEISKWLSSSLRFGRYFKLTHDIMISNRKNKLFFISVDEKFIGLVGLKNIDIIDNRAEVWFLIGSESCRRKNYVTDALNLIKIIVKKDLKLISLYAHVAEPNTASVKTLEKNGFEYVGKFRKAFFVHGLFTDYLVFDWISN